METTLKLTTGTEKQIKYANDLWSKFGTKELNNTSSYFLSRWFKADESKREKMKSNRPEKHTMAMFVLDTVPTLTDAGKVIEIINMSDNELLIDHAKKVANS